MMTKKTMTILSVFMIVALTAVGFAAWLIVGTIEADPFAGKISNDSPLGKAISGKNVGDTFIIAAENGKEHRVQLVELK